MNKKTKVYNDSTILGNAFRRYYFSSMFAIVCGCLGQIVGNILVGNNLGEDKLAVVSLVLPVYYVFATIGNLAGVGGSALCAEYIGKRENEACKKCFTATCIFSMGSCIFFSVLFMLLLPRIVVFLGTPKDLLAEVYSYSSAMIVFGVFTAGVYISFNMLRLEGKSLSSTLTFVFMVVVNILFDLLLMPLKMLGISIANGLGAMVATVFGIAVIVLKGNFLGFTKISLKDFFCLAGRILKRGSPGATENASILIRSYLFNQLIVTVVGASALSPLSIINSINSFSMSITVGCAGALVPFISVFGAEKDTVSIQKTVKEAVRLSAIWLALFFAAVFIFSPDLARLFGFVSEISEVSGAIRLFLLSLPFSLAANVLIYVYLANMQTAIANLLTVFHSLIYAVAGAFVLMKFFGTTGLWLSFALCELMTVLTAWLISVSVRMKNKNLSTLLLLDTQYEQRGKSISMITKDNEKDISEALDQVRDFCKDNALSRKQSMLITLSMEEMLHLAAAYSTVKSKYHIISFRILIHEDVLVMRLRYDGEMFNIISFYQEKKNDTEDIDSLLELNDLLGMKLVIDACKEVDFQSTFGMNNLTIIV